MNHRVTAIILAAGQGTRMKSVRPKVLHEVCGRPMIDHVVLAAFDAGADDAVVVVGSGRDEVTAHLRSAFGDRVRTALQAEQRGTADAVTAGLTEVGKGTTTALLLYGDTPLVAADDLRRVLEARGDGPLAMLTCQVDDPTGYGRVVRDGEGRIRGVREHRDASEAELCIGEVNPGMYAARLDFLRRALSELRPDNNQGELYLTDIVALGAEAGGVAGCRADSASCLGVNDRAHLDQAEQVCRARIADGWRRAGVTLRTSARVDATVRLEPDARIEHGVVLRGRTHVAAGAVVDVGSVLTDVEVAEGAYVRPYTVASSSTIGRDAHVGPFSHLRPGSTLHAGAHVGNFVETKNTTLREGAKANHLAYLGDGDIGEGANVGAGTIFCNYDGYQKHRTEIARGAFIGSDSQLIAPVRIGEGAYVATGTTVTRDVPDNALAIARSRQENKEDYATVLRARLSARRKPASPSERNES